MMRLLKNKNKKGTVARSKVLDLVLLLLTQLTPSAAGLISTCRKLWREHNLIKLLLSVLELPS